MLGDFFSGHPTQPVNLQSPSVVASTGILTVGLVTYTNPNNSSPVSMTTVTTPLFVGSTVVGDLNPFHLLSVAASQNAPLTPAGFTPSTVNSPASSGPGSLPIVPNSGRYPIQATSGTVLNVIVNPNPPFQNDLTEVEQTITKLNGQEDPHFESGPGGLANAAQRGYVSFPQPPGGYTAFVFKTTGGGLEVALPGDFTHVFMVNLPFAATAGSFKLGDNESPLPRDRVIFDYSFFDNTTLAPGGVNVNRFTAGFEKTLFSDQVSIEFRLPFATTFDSDITVDGNNGNTSQTSQRAIELGNCEFLSKFLLWRTDTVALTGGLGVGLPTASDITVNRSDGVNLYRIENTAPHVIPFVGGAWVPNERFFFQDMIQFDFDITGNQVVINEDPNKQFSSNGTFVDAGRLKDPVFAFVDLSTGYWFFHNPPGSNRCITGLAGIFELHYNQTLAGFNSVSAPILNSTGQQQSFWNPGKLRPPFIFPQVEPGELEPLALEVGGGGPFSSLDLTAGVTIEVRDDAFFSLGCSVPLLAGAGREFDYEIRANFSYYFGRSTKSSRSGIGSAPSTL